MGQVHDFHDAVYNSHAYGHGGVHAGQQQRFQQ
jgi:hypothetical protein